MSYKIITDSCCDLSGEMAKELELAVVPLNVEMDGVSFEDGQMSPKEFYDSLRAGKTAKTAAVNPERWGREMENALAAGEDVLVAAFSSGLSTTYQSAVIAAEELRERYPERKILVVDTLAASRGQGLLVYYAAKQRQAGKPMEEVAQWMEDHKWNLAHWFTVDDLMHLKRGGRVSAATAVMGTMLQIKPVLHVDDEGKLVSMSKARGRKAALNALADCVEKTQLPGENDVMFICHSDCAADAEFVAGLVKKRFGVKEVYIHDIGSVIGSHTGPGTVGLFFLAEHR